MTSNPACGTTDMPLQEIARLMVDCDCGEIPIVERHDMKRPVGVVTDRDIVCRALAAGKNPLTMNAGSVMTSPAITAKQDDDVDTIKGLMETHQIRRIPVVDPNGEICGIVSLADIARRDSKKDVGEVVRQVSVPTR
jgi:CBS domain-containing protein